ncbi:MAG: YqiA/YcfP family alpha/beta fold hydrolase [Legionella sp.]|jgi:carboxylesterase
MVHKEFSYMQRGKHVRPLEASELALLGPIDQRGKGKDRALLALHGFSSTPAVFRLLLPKLQQYDAIVSPLLSGPELGIKALANSKASDWLNTSIKACAELCQNYKQVDVLGLSLGGLLACELSKIYSLNHLYLLAPALKLHLKVKACLKVAKILQSLGIYSLKNKAGNLVTSEHAEIAPRRIPLSIIIEMLQYNLNYQWIVPKCPVDVFLGVQDAVVASDQVAKMFADAPNAKIHWLDNSAHVLPLDNDFDAIAACITENYATKL